MAVTILAAVALAFALLPAVVYRFNVRLYRPAPPASDKLPPVSVLIPARNEERAIGPAVESALSSRGVELEVVVLDDHSEDGTAAVVREIMGRDNRVRLIESAELPDGWCGKQHACHQLGAAAAHPLLLFVDADVRLAPDAVCRLATFLQQSEADLASGIPRQDTGSALEKLVLPLIHFLLLGFLPMSRMRRYTHPGYGAGCGQLFITHRSAYDVVGGHGAVRGSLHDGVTLPRAYRRNGLRTDLCDATDLARCRMYKNGRDLWMGLAKNAREGLGSPAAIAPWTAVLGVGQVVPFALLAMAPWLTVTQFTLALAGAVAGYSIRFDAANRFRQSWVGALCHPVGVVALLSVQWYASYRVLIGRPVGWKGRVHPSAVSAPVEAVQRCEVTPTR